MGLGCRGHLVDRANPINIIIEKRIDFVKVRLTATPGRPGRPMSPRGPGTIPSKPDESHASP